MRPFSVGRKYCKVETIPSSTRLSKARQAYKSRQVVYLFPRHQELEGLREDQKQKSFFPWQVVKGSLASIQSSYCIKLYNRRRLYGLLGVLPRSWALLPLILAMSTKRHELYERILGFISDHFDWFVTRTSST